jgi:hypothetical protein
MVEAYYRMGFTTADIEVWSVGVFGDAWYLNGFSTGVSGACFEDTPQGTAASALRLRNDWLAILNRDLVTREAFDMSRAPLFQVDSRRAIEDLVNSLL